MHGHSNSNINSSIITTGRTNTASRVGLFCRDHGVGVFVKESAYTNDAFLEFLWWCGYRGSLGFLETESIDDCVYSQPRRIQLNAIEDGQVVVMSDSECDGRKFEVIVKLSPTKVLHITIPTSPGLLIGTGTIK